MQNEQCILRIISVKFKPIMPKTDYLFQINVIMKSSFQMILL